MILMYVNGGIGWRRSPPTPAEISDTAIWQELTWTTKRERRRQKRWHCERGQFGYRKLLYVKVVF